MFTYLLRVWEGNCGFGQGVKYSIEASSTNIGMETTRSHLAD